MTEQRRFADVAVGDRIATLEFPLPLFRLVMAAGATRDSSRPSIGPLPALEIEAAVLAQVHKALQEPEMIVGVWQAGMALRWKVGEEETEEKISRTGIFKEPAPAAASTSNHMPWDGVHVGVSGGFEWAANESANFTYAGTSAARAGGFDEIGVWRFNDGIHGTHLQMTGAPERGADFGSGRHAHAASAAVSFLAEATAALRASGPIATPSARMKMMSVMPRKLKTAFRYVS